MPVDCDKLESECDAWLRDEWRGSEERMRSLVVEARSAVCELRRLLHVIENAETRHAVMHPAGVCIGLYRDSLVAEDSAEACGGKVVECKVVPVAELGESNAG